jgi:hypothetical protein
MNWKNKVVVGVAVLVFFTCAYCDWKGYTERFKHVVLFFQSASFSTIVMALIVLEKKSKTKDTDSN